MRFSDPSLDMLSYKLNDGLTALLTPTHELIRLNICIKSNVKHRTERYL